MKKLIYLSLLITASFASCDHNSEADVHVNLNGTYIGTFERNGRVSNVELDLAEDRFSGTSDTDKYPAICSGIYSNNTVEITFSNHCAWTADFDWSLILSDTWTFNLSEDQLIMTKANGDKYSLTKQ